MADQSISEKTCSSCKVNKPTTEFGTNRTKKDGLTDKCHPCKQAYDAAYYIHNRERQLANCKTYREEHKEEVRTRLAAYYLKHREIIRTRSGSRYRDKTTDILAQQKARRDSDVIAFRRNEYERYWRNPDRMRVNARRSYKAHADKRNKKVRVYQQQHKEKARGWKKKWQQSHREHRRVINRNGKAMRRSAKGRFTFQLLIAKYDYHGWQCYLCKTPITLKTSHPDHRKAVSQGGTNWIANIAPACIRCNLSKGHKSESEFRSALAIKLKSRPPSKENRDTQGIAPFNC